MQVKNQVQTQGAVLFTSQVFCGEFDLIYSRIRNSLRFFFPTHLTAASLFSGVFFFIDLPWSSRVAVEHILSIFLGGRGRVFRLRGIAARPL